MWMQNMDRREKAMSLFTQIITGRTRKVLQIYPPPKKKQTKNKDSFLWNSFDLVKNF